MIGGFSFAFNRLLITGSGKLFKIDQYLPVKRGRIAVVAAPSFISGPYGDKYLNCLRSGGFDPLVCEVHGEPSPETVNGISTEFSDFHPDVIAAVGGGSVIDAGKAVSAMIPVAGKVEEYLEGLGDRIPTGEKIPFVALPTTSGTGSEGTMNAVISRKGPAGFKKSIRHPNYIPDAAILDPELILSCPPSVTAACGMDAFSQLLESYVSSKASPLSDLLARDGLKHFLSSFDLLMADLENPSLRMEIALAAYYSGLTLANVGLGVVHGLSGPLGGFSEMNHGAACGTLLADAFRMTVEKIRSQAGSTDDSGPGASALAKMSSLGSYMEGTCLSREEGLECFIEKLEAWKIQFSLPLLSEFGLKQADLVKVAEAGSNKNHPVAFSKADMVELLECRL